jgi:transglutaminase/protease-like cytokinesis protein 3
MTYDKRFYGLYEGICTNNQDPDKTSKIKLKVPQVLGQAETDWAYACLPVTDNANHPDHKPHTAAQVAVLLTTQSTSASGSDPQGGSVSITIPALTVVAKNSNTLTHAHQTSTDPLDTNTNSPEHTYHRKVPNVGQKVWVMFIAGDPNFPVWMGVYV